jgi:hypothetical protein
MTPPNTPAPTAEAPQVPAGHQAVITDEERQRLSHHVMLRCRERGKYNRGDVEQCIDDVLTVLASLRSAAVAPRVGGERARGNSEPAHDS